MNNNKNFNLIYEPWLPCILNDGQYVELGLLECLKSAHRIHEIYAESPLINAALYRLLIAIIQRVLGPKDWRSWRDLWLKGSFSEEPLRKYFENWDERFYLFHPERPFYQKQDDRVKPKSLINLVHQFSSGNNPTLFDHHIEESDVDIAFSEAARFLITSQSYGLAGLSGIPQKFTDGSCSRGIIFLVEGENLFETIILNTFKYPDESGIDIFPQDDMPAWEMDDPFKLEREIPSGLLDLLTWQNRLIYFILDNDDGNNIINKMTVAPGLRLDANIIDPMKVYRIDEKRGNLVLRFHEERVLWRDSAVLLNLNPDRKTKPPKSLEWLAYMIEKGVLDAYKSYRYLGFGMCNDQAKVHFYRQESMPLPLAFLKDQDLVAKLAESLSESELVKQKLWGAMSTLAERFLVPNSDMEGARKPDRGDISNLITHWGAERTYWSSLELSFQELLINLPKNELNAREQWRDELRKVSRSALEVACQQVGQDSRGLKASVQARSQLNIGLKKIIPQPENEGA